VSSGVVAEQAVAIFQQTLQIFDKIPTNSYKLSIEINDNYGLLKILILPLNFFELDFFSPK